MLSLHDFSQLHLEDKQLFDQVYQQYPPNHSDYLFTTMISWMQYGNYHIAQLQNSIIILTKIHQDIRFRPPIGKQNKQKLEQLFKLAQQEGSLEPIGVIDTPSKKWISQVFPNMNFTEHRDYFDYVYKASDLAMLQGSSYAKIRNRLNKFKNKYEYSVEEITESNIDEIKEFLKRWCLWKDCESDEVLENERIAILFSMAHFFDLHLSGIALRVNDAIEAISVYEQLNLTTAVVHYEKGSPDYDGIYKAINMETAKKLQNKVEYINRESDMGIPGLRKAKMSYRPHHLEKVYHIKKEDMLF